MFLSRGKSSSLQWFERLALSRKPDLTVKVGDQIYLERYWLIPRNKWFNIYLHKISMSDEPTLHNHPWASLSYVLKGEFFEHLMKGSRICNQGKFYYRSKDLFHSLGLMDNKPAWTLFMTGPVRQSWGFLSEHGWIHSKTYKGRKGVTTIQEGEY